MLQCRGALHGLHLGSWPICWTLYVVLSFLVPTSFESSVHNYNFFPLISCSVFILCWLFSLLICTPFLLAGVFSQQLISWPHPWHIPRIPCFIVFNFESQFHILSSFWKMTHMLHDSSLLYFLVFWCVHLSTIHVKKLPERTLSDVLVVAVVNPDPTFYM